MKIKALTKDEKHNLLCGDLEKLDTFIRAIKADYTDKDITSAAEKAALTAVDSDIKYVDTVLSIRLEPGVDYRRVPIDYYGEGTGHWDLCVFVTAKVQDIRANVYCIVETAAYLSELISCHPFPLWGWATHVYR